MQLTELEMGLIVSVKMMMKETKKFNTQKKLAAALGYTQPYISQVLSGKKAVPIRLLVDICLLHKKVPILTFKELCNEQSSAS